jgi:hypothetical protein
VEKGGRRRSGDFWRKESLEKIEKSKIYIHHRAY